MSLLGESSQWVSFRGEEAFGCGVGEDEGTAGGGGSTEISCRTASFQELAALLAEGGSKHCAGQYSKEGSEGSEGWEREGEELAMYDPRSR